MRTRTVYGLVFTLALASAATAVQAQEWRFPPRKPLPYPERVTGLGPVLASPPSARYVAWRYGIRPALRLSSRRGPVVRLSHPRAPLPVTVRPLPVYRQPVQLSVRPLPGYRNRPPVRMMPAAPQRLVISVRPDGRRIAVLPSPRR